MTENRKDPLLWEEIYLGAEEMAADCSMERNMPQAASNYILKGRWNVVPQSNGYAIEKSEN